MRRSFMRDVRQRHGEEHEVALHVAVRLSGARGDRQSDGCHERGDSDVFCRANGEMKLHVSFQPPA